MISETVLREHVFAAMKAIEAREMLKIAGTSDGVPTKAHAVTVVAMNETPGKVAVFFDRMCKTGPDAYDARNESTIAAFTAEEWEPLNDTERIALVRRRAAEAMGHFRTVPLGAGPDVDRLNRLDIARSLEVK